MKQIVLCAIGAAFPSESTARRDCILMPALRLSLAYRGALISLSLWHMSLILIIHCLLKQLLAQRSQTRPRDKSSNPHPVRSRLSDEIQQKSSSALMPFRSQRVQSNKSHSAAGWCIKRFPNACPVELHGFHRIARDLIVCIEILLV